MIRTILLPWMLLLASLIAPAALGALTDRDARAAADGLATPSLQTVQR